VPGMEAQLGEFPRGDFMEGQFLACSGLRNWIGTFQVWSVPSKHLNSYFKYMRIGLYKYYIKDDAYERALDFLLPVACYLA